MLNDPQFNKHYRKYRKYRRLGGMQPKTIEAYSRANRRIDNYFNCRIDNLASDQLLDYFNELLECHSWSTVKLDLYGLKFLLLQGTGQGLAGHSPDQTAEDIQDPGYSVH